MTDKSYVSMEQHLCLVCAKPFETNNLLLDKRLKASMDHHTVTGWGLCPEHKKLYDEGYLALVAADESKSTKLPNGTIKPEGAYRTGGVAHIRRTVAKQVFNIPINDTTAVMFCDKAVIAQLKDMMDKAAKE